MTHVYYEIKKIISFFGHANWLAKYASTVIAVLILSKLGNNSIDKNIK